MTSRITTATLAKLGEIILEDRDIELVWLTGRDSVMASFTTLEPKRIGTVIGLNTSHARLIVCESQHLDWIKGFNRGDLLVVAAIDHYSHREVLAREAEA